LIINASADCQHTAWYCA